MPISVCCPHCQHEMMVPDSLAGQVSQCVMCRESMTIPGKPPEPVAAAPSETAEPPAPPAPPPPPDDAESSDVTSDSPAGGFDLAVSGDAAVSRAATTTARDRHARQRAQSRRTIAILSFIAVLIIGGVGYWGLRYGERSRLGAQIKEQALSRYSSFATKDVIQRILDANHEACFAEAYSFMTIDENAYFEKMDPIMEKELNLVRIESKKKGKKKAAGTE